MAKIKNLLGRRFSTERLEDKLTAEARSILMSKIKSKRTSFETKFFDQLIGYGVLFEPHPKGLTGRPDIYIESKKLCIFLDSNFWHGWQYPRWKHKLKNDFWRNKIEKNRLRDKKVTAKLKREGYQVLRIWEHQIKSDLQGCINKVLSVIEC